MSTQDSLKDFILQTISNEALANRCVELAEYPSNLRGYVMGYMHGLSDGFPDGCNTEAELRVLFNRLCYIEGE